MSPLAATQWLTTQLPAMETALEALVKVNSYSQNPEGGREVGRLLQQLFALDGLSCEVVKSERFADHLVFRSAGDGRAPVALIGHLDTVFPPGHFEGYRVDGELRRGPGVLDMKGGLVVIAWALKAAAQTVGLSKLPPLRLVIVADEEVGSPEGAPLLRRVVADAQAALVFESGRANDAIVTARKGTGSLTVRATGKAAHAGNNYTDGANAIWALSRFIDRAQQLTDLPAGTTVNAGAVKGGTSKNTVPAEASAEFDLRFSTAKAREGLLADLQRLCAEAAVPGTSLALEVSTGRLPMERTDASGKLVEAYGACAKRHGLSADEAPRQGGGSDGNTTAALGIPTIDALGPRGKGFHTPDEYIEVGTLIPRAQALAEWLLTR